MSLVRREQARLEGERDRATAVVGAARRVRFGRYALAALLAAAILFSAACGGDSESAATDATASQATAAPAAKDGEIQTLSANNASEADLAAAFEAAEISNAAKWAHEVVEYRPYPEDDKEFAKLRRELAKYNPAEGVVDSIVALLRLP